MEPSSEIKIILSEQEAKEYILFQKHWEMFNLMLERGVFDQKNAAVTLHFDSVGTLQIIQRADSLYSRKHDLTQKQ